MNVKILNVENLNPFFLNDKLNPFENYIYNLKNKTLHYIWSFELFFKKSTTSRGKIISNFPTFDNLKDTWPFLSKNKIKVETLNQVKDP
jgi:hypothetical protein